MNDDLIIGFENLEKQLSRFLKSAEDVSSVLEVGAQAYVDDLLRLPKPYRQIKSYSYTHLVESFTYRKNSDGTIDVGSIKYYSIFVDKGTRFQKAQPFYKPVFGSNKARYYQEMINKLYKGV